MAAVSGIGAWFPDEIRTNAAWPEDFRARSQASKQRTFNDIESAQDPAYRVTDEFLRAEAEDPFLGVRARRVAHENTTAVDAEVLAAELALRDAGLSPGAIDCVISYSAVPDRPTPPSASAVAARLGIENTLAWGMDAACATALVQIATASALIESGCARHVLLTQSHLILRTFPMLHPAAPGLGDASTALVVSARGRWPLLAFHAVTAGEHYRSVTWVREQADGVVDAKDTSWWKPGGAFRVGTQDLPGAKALQRDTVAYGAQTLREAARKAEIDIDRIGLLASAEPRGWIPKGILHVLGLSEDLASSVYEDRAHLGASGCIANLEKAYRTGRTPQSGVAALYAQGAGFTRAAVLLKTDS